MLADRDQLLANYTCRLVVRELAIIIPHWLVVLFTAHAQKHSERWKHIIMIDVLQKMHETTLNTNAVTKSGHEKIAVLKSYLFYRI